MNTTIQFAIGSAMGVLTVPLLLLCGSLLKRRARSWLAEALLRDETDVSGLWQSSLPGLEGWPITTLSLSQIGRRVEGLATFAAGGDTPGPAAGPLPQEMRVHGHVVRDRFVQLRLRDARDRRLGVLCYLLEATDHGKALRGTFFSRGSDSVPATNEEVELHRSSA